MFQPGDIVLIVSAEGYNHPNTQTSYNMVLGYIGTQWTVVSSKIMPSYLEPTGGIEWYELTGELPKLVVSAWDLVLVEPAPPYEPEVPKPINWTPLIILGGILLLIGASRKKV